MSDRMLVSSCYDFFSFLYLTVLPRNVTWNEKYSLLYVDNPVSLLNPIGDVE